MISLIFDVETSGLFPKGANYKTASDFDAARLVSISWIMAQGDTIVEQAYYVIKPDTWQVPESSTNIHGISHEEALSNGDDINVVLKNFMACVVKSTNIVAHNISFDEAIIKSELYRYGFKADLEVFKSKHKICTMLKGRLYMKVRKYPKLSELYKFLYSEEITNAHNAAFDTKFCFNCFIKLFPSDPDTFYFGDKEVKLTIEQSKVVFEKIDTNMLVIAAAGSGKTTSIITRVKYMVDSGVPENSIILTTFTRNAANDIRDKLFDIMGYKCDIQVGTIDSIAKFFVSKYLETQSEEVQNVEEYAPLFLQLMQSKPAFLKKIKYLLVDEVQDINQIQHDIMHHFYQNGACIIGIGDDSQNIYEFRGSNIEYILNFHNVFQPTIVHKLTNNFRSTPEIVKLANAVIEHNKNKICKTMISSNPYYNNIETTRPIVKCFRENTDQYVFVLDRIKFYLANTGFQEDSICIMSPLNKPLIEMQELLTTHGIEYFYCKGEDDSRTIKRPGCVSLNTIHKSKGLEWDIVFLISMNDDQNKNIYHFNGHNSAKCLKLLEANRRLFYVAITRAKQHLYVLSSLFSTRSHDITRFVNEVPVHLFS